MDDREINAHDRALAQMTEQMMRDFDLISVRFRENGKVWKEPSILMVHRLSRCQGLDVGCVIHNNSPHHMRDWAMVWDSTEHVMYRLCPHGECHTDPDDAAFRESVVGYRRMGETVSAEEFTNALIVRSYLGTHECSCKCCIKENMGE